MCEHHSHEGPFYVQIKKAKKVELSAEWELLHDIADDYIPVMQVDFARAVKNFHDSIDIDELSEAIATGKASKVSAVMDWGTASFAGMNKRFRSAMKDAAGVSSEFLPESLGIKNPDKIYSDRNAAIDDWMDQYSAARVTFIGEQQKQAIQEALKYQRERGVSNASTAKLLVDNIGLNGPQARAMVNLEDRLRGAGMSEKQVQDKLESYKKRAIKYRSKMIAHTEMIDAVNQGQLELWHQAHDEGYFTYSQVRKAWITTPDDKRCPSCKAMDGQRRKLKELFRDPEKIFVPVYRPGLHPWCRCGMKLIYIA